jgi:zinc transport system substrate-binding protein
MKYRLWLLLALALAGCGTPPQAARPAGKITIFVTVPPQAYFAKRIAGDLGEVHTLVPPGQDPHSFASSPREMAELAQAQIYFRVGLPVEETLLPKIQSANPRLVIVDTRQGLPLRRPEPGDEPSSVSGLDPHIWLSPVLAKKQAETMREALIKIAPSGKSVFENNYASLAGDLDRLQARLQKILAPVRGKSFFVFHPAYGYFAREYGLKQVAVEAGGRPPGARQLAELVAQAKAQGVKVIFVQPQFSTQSAQTLADAIGAKLIPLDDLSEDYLANLKSAADKLEAALAEQK